MLLTRKNTVRDADEAVLPLINIVFLLMIFFMLTIVYTPTPLYDIQAPGSDTNNPNDLEEGFLELSADGKLAWSGQPVTDLQLRDILQSKFTIEQRAEMQLHADRATDVERLVQVMQLLQISGVDNLILITENN